MPNIMITPSCFGVLRFRAQQRLLHVREFLIALNDHFPEGIPLDYSAAIRCELAPLEEAALRERDANDVAIAQEIATA
jgi:hypothetical protein